MTRSAPSRRLIKCVVVAGVAAGVWYFAVWFLAGTWAAIQ